MNKYTVSKSELFSVDADNKTDAITIVKNIEDYAEEGCAELFNSSVSVWNDEELDGGCEYCNSEDYIDMLTYKFFIDKQSRKINVSTKDNNTTYNLKIKYCPLCGNEL